MGKKVILRNAPQDPNVALGPVPDGKSRMCISRYPGQSLMVGETRIRIAEVRGERVYIYLEVPRELRVDRPSKEEDKASRIRRDHGSVQDELARANNEICRLRAIVAQSRGEKRAKWDPTAEPRVAGLDGEE
jgi:sRNA-binding carbon storage regulator CsrA